MAHIGRFYRLHFRRDLGIDIFNNNRGLAAEYSVGIADVNGLIGGPLSSMHVLASAADEKTFSGALWRSSWLSISGHQVRYKIEASLATDWPTNYCRVTIEDQSLGVLLAVNCINDHRSDLAFLQCRQIFTPATNPPLLDTSGPNVLVQLSAVRWAR